MSFLASASDNWMNPRDHRCVICRDTLLQQDNALYKKDNYIQGACAAEHGKEFHKKCLFGWFKYCKINNLEQHCPKCRTPLDITRSHCMLCKQKLKYAENSYQDRAQHQLRGACLKEHGYQYHAACLQNLIKEEKARGTHTTCHLCKKYFFTGPYSAWPTMKQIISKPSLTFIAAVTVASSGLCVLLPEAEHDPRTGALLSFNILSLWALAFSELR